MTDLEKYLLKIYKQWLKFLKIEKTTISRDNRIKALASVTRKRRKYHIKYNMKGIRSKHQVLCVVLHELFHIRCYEKLGWTDIEIQEYYAERAMLFVLKKINKKCYEYAIRSDRSFLADPLTKGKYPDHFKAFEKALRMQ